jgi:hypothetical protein
MKGSKKESDVRTVSIMEAAFMKGNYGPGDASRLIQNGAIVGVQVFLG